MSNYTEYRDATDTNAAPSPIIWADCPVGEFIEKGNGYFFQDDFLVVPEPLTNVAEGAAQAGNYSTFTGADAVISSGAGTGGEIFINASASNVGCGIRGGGAPFTFATDAGKFWFEARVKFGTIADDQNGAFIGMFEDVPHTNTVPIAADGTMADENFVGFHRFESDGDKLDIVHKKDSVTQVSVADQVALTADTYVKIGMKFANNSMEFYADGVLLTTILNTATSFPSDINLGIIFATLGEAAEDTGVTMDWWRVAQAR
tara:strand:+ start:2927 stop:3706 length:780 start_codon:yes stop_codon:yes gene_type:complete